MSQETETVEAVSVALEIRQEDGTWFPLDLAACLNEATKAHLRQSPVFRLVVYGHSLLPSNTPQETIPLQDRRPVA